MNNSLKTTTWADVSTTGTKSKRNLDNTDIIKHFGKGKSGVWKKDIETGKGNF